MDSVNQNKIQHLEGAIAYGPGPFQYFKVALVFALLLVFLVIPAALVLGAPFGLLAFVLAASNACWRIAQLRLTELVFGSDGVYYRDSWLPWRDGYDFMAWRDISKVAYVPSLSSWIVRDYRMVVIHRFDSSRSIRVRSIAADRLESALYLCNTRLHG